MGVALQHSDSTTPTRGGEQTRRILAPNFYCIEVAVLFVVLEGLTGKVSDLGDFADQGADVPNRPRFNLVQNTV